MATRPKVHRRELEAAITRIAARRAKIDDYQRERLPDSPDSDPREILDYLQRHSGPSIPVWVLRADVGDALILNNWLWWEDRRRELHFLRAGRDRGLFLSQLGAQLGVGKQGVLDRIDRLEALLRYDRPDEKISRASRRAERERLDRSSAEQAWLAHRHGEVSALITDFVAHADRYGIADREWIDELEADARDEELNATTMVILGLAAGELRSAPAVMRLDGARPHAVHTTLARAEHLRGQFAALNPRKPSPRAS